MRKSSRIRVLGIAAAAALTIGSLATAPAFAQARYEYGYHNGYSDHHWGWGYGGYYDGYVGSYGAYNDTPAWGYSYEPAYSPTYYGYGYSPYYDDGYYPYGYAPAPGVGVQVGPVGVGLW